MQVNLMGVSCMVSSSCNALSCLWQEAAYLEQATRIGMSMF